MTSYIHCKKDSAIKCGPNSVQFNVYCKYSPVSVERKMELPAFGTIKAN